MQGLFAVLSLVVYEDYMYCTSAADNRLNRCDKFNCANKTVMNIPSMRMTNMFLYHPVAQLPCT